VVGALALYGLGAWLGRDRLLTVAERIPLMKVSDVERTERWFARHGTKAVFFGRMVPVFRSLVSVPAGLSGAPSRTDEAQGRMPLGLFLALTTLGSGIWNTAFVLAGYQLGEDWHRVSDAVGLYSRVIVIAVVVGLLAFVGYRLVRPGRGSRRRGR
jgi:membrane protein DedA with SNARE-associated domain